MWSFTHGTSLSDGDHDLDQNRLQPTVPMQQHFVARWLEFYEAMLHEVFAMYRTARQLDAVKLVAVDLDDTLWRGVAAEGTLGAAEGWPMGFMETLLYLKKRGIILAIVSKNDEKTALGLWDKLYESRFSIRNFAATRIDWNPKSINVGEIIKAVNVLPGSVLFVDGGSDAYFRADDWPKPVPARRVLSYLWRMKRFKPYGG